MTDSVVLLDKKSPVNASSYVEKLSSGEFIAGREKKTARTFKSAREVYDFYYPFAVDGDHGAWNICYTVEDYFD